MGESWEGWVMDLWAGSGSNDRLTCQSRTEIGLGGRQDSRLQECHHYCLSTDLFVTAIEEAFGNIRWRSTNESPHLDSSCARGRLS